MIIKIIKRCLVVLIVTVATLSALVLADPEHFTIYDMAGAGQTYLATLGNTLENAYSEIKSKGVSLAPPCEQQRYIVYVVNSGVEGGITSTKYTYDSTGQIRSACIVDVKFIENLSGSTLRKVVYHELMHFAQAAYYRYVNILQSCPWYIEGTAEGFACYLTGICSSEPLYYGRRLYYLDPYSMQCTQENSYSTGAFFHWLISSGYALMPTAFEQIFSTPSVQVQWLNTAYTRFLLSIVKGQSLCGTLYHPYMQTVRLTGDQWSTSITLQGLSARYYIIELPNSCVVEIKVSNSEILSNLKLNDAFKVENQTLYLALVNPSSNTISLTLTLSVGNYLSVRVIGGSYNAITGQLIMDLSVATGSTKITGPIYVNGSLYQADNGHVTVQLSGLSWGSYVLPISYEGMETSLRFSLNPPTFMPITKSPIYVSIGGYGRIVINVDNSNPFKVYMRLLLEPPSTGDGEALIFENKAVNVELQPGRKSLELSFTVNQSSSQGYLLIKAQYSLSSPVVVQYLIVPADIAVTEVLYNSTTGVTTAKLFVPQLNAYFSSSFNGFSGKASAVYDTYIIGVISLRIPAITITLQAMPEIVAPDWVLASVEANVTTIGSCPAFPATYMVQLRVNSTSLGSVSLLCGDTATFKGAVNTTRPRNAWRVKFTANDKWSTLMRLTPPRINVTPLNWLIHDEGITTNITVSVFGPHKYYLANRVFSNSSENLVLSFPAGSANVSFDLGFIEMPLTVPPVKLLLSIPQVSLNPLVKGRIKAETNAWLNASLSLKLNNTEIFQIRLIKAGEATIEKEFALNLSTLGFYKVLLETWFAEADASIYYVKVKGVSLSAPQFLLVGGKSLVNVTIYTQPPLPLPLNLTVTQLEEPHSVTLKGNSTLELSYDKPKIIKVMISILNYTASTWITWDYLNLYLENTLGRFNDTLVLPNTAVKAYSVFSNGTRVPVTVFVNGKELFQPEGLGENMLTLSTSYLGCINETRIKVYIVPENLYREAFELLALTGKPKSLAELIQVAVITGKWMDVEKLIIPYQTAKLRAGYYDPIGILALELVKHSAITGDLMLSSYVKTILDYEVFIYFLAAALATVVIIKKTRFKQSSSSKTVKSHN
ncbi:MAG: hypothetical protein QW731_00420 [Thermofilaceae archaeon]